MVSAALLRASVSPAQQSVPVQTLRADWSHFVLRRASFQQVQLAIKIVVVVVREATRHREGAIIYVVSVFDNNGKLQLGALMQMVTSCCLNPRRSGVARSLLRPFMVAGRAGITWQSLTEATSFIICITSVAFFAGERRLGTAGTAPRVWFSTMTSGAIPNVCRHATTERAD